jgi:hypothetical protein
MNSTHLMSDILRSQADGQFIWIEAVENLELGKARVAELIGLVPGGYLLFNETTHAKLLISPTSEREYKADDMTQAAS